jgi:hypothetical protein
VVVVTVVVIFDPSGPVLSVITTSVRTGQEPGVGDDAGVDEMVGEREGEAMGAFVGD